MARLLSQREPRLANLALHLHGRFQVDQAMLNLAELQTRLGGKSSEIDALLEAW